jgi:hypothetical protein
MVKPERGRRRFELEIFSNEEQKENQRVEIIHRRMSLRQQLAFRKHMVRLSFGRASECSA